MPNYNSLRFLVLFLAILNSAPGQSLGNYGSIHGVVTDASNASVPSALVTLGNPLTGVQRTTSSDTGGAFQLNGIPFGPYRVTAVAPGFRESVQNISIESPVPLALKVSLSLAAASTSVDVSDKPLTIIELSPTARGTIDHTLLDRLPVQNQATGLSELVTRTTPGVAADGNGFAHPLGEHADTSISLDNQPITDQQAKIFSNQLSTSIVQTLEVITGAPPAEYGDKTSLIINVTTQSGLGRAKPFGSVSSQYGSFGTWSEGVTYGTGSQRWGNFAALNASGSGRFLDTPEFLPLHDHGNAESIFDRFDLQPTETDTLHLNLSVARSWFQTPNTFDSQDAGQDQRSQIRSFNIAPSWTHLLNSSLLFTLNPFIRFDRSQYFPSANPLSDLPATLSQSRYLLNAGFRTDLAYSRGKHNAKFGASYWHTLLREDFNVAVTDPAYNAVCLDRAGLAVPNPALVSANQCQAAQYQPNPSFIPNLLPNDLTRGGRPYAFHGDADVKELAFYVQDSINLGRLSLNPGLRYDRYNGLSQGHQLQPRFGLAYRTPWTNTVVRLSYARLFETPYNENLIIASEASSNTQAANPFATFRSYPPLPGNRNQFNAGLAQAFGRHLTVDADYFWKFTKNAFDFDSLFLTPITFPIGWRKSKIDGLALRVTLAETHGFSAYTVMGHTRSRFFGPEIGGLIFNNVPNNGVFRIDHSEEFQQTTYVRYQIRKSGPWTSFTWRFNSGLALPGVVPDYASALQLSGDEQAQMGLYCGNTYATRSSPITSCTASNFGATRVSIPAAGTHNDDLHPTRVSARNVFDAGIGMDNLLHTDRYKVQTRLTVLNLTNTVALYNFLSTFSGTHFVTPRTFQAEMRLVF
ncbi:MAG TPA: TonB-dependent receptor [Bryobacteraceae bacterium]|nr:TonB-dependent receptor [Bryobacteraceae bacterium]